MKEVRDPLEILNYEIALSELMKSVPEFESAYDQYAKERRASSGYNKPRRKSSQSLGSTHPILLQIYNTREAINEFFRTGELPINDQVKDTITVGRALSNLESTAVIDPSAKVLKHGVGGGFAERLWKEDDYWDTVFELEIASALREARFSPKLVEEGQQIGPDVVVNSEGHEVWVECKRKRPKPQPEREQEAAIKEIIDAVYDGVDLGEDSLAIEIRGPRLLRKNDVGPIADTATKLAQDQCLKSEVSRSDGTEFEVELVDYYEGRWETNVQPQWLETLQQYVDISNAVDTFGHLNYSIDPEQSYGHAEEQFKVSHDGKLSVVNGYIVGVYCSEEIDYVGWIMQPIKKARRKLSGHEPSVILVDVPIQKIDAMEELYTTDHRGNKVTQQKRLEQRINGQLADSDTISAIIITSRVDEQLSQGIQQGRLIKAYVNHSPAVDLPENLRAFFEGTASENEAD